MIIKKKNGLNTRIFIWASALVMALAITSAPPARASDANDAQGIVDKARVTLTDFIGDKNFTWLNENLKNAKGLLIFPQVLKAGYIIGGSGGTGILVVRDENTGDWSQPAFYTIGSASIGLQIGAESAQTIMMVMSKKAVRSLYESSVKLGGDTSFAVGPVGEGAKGNLAANFISFSKSKGLYAGLNLEGSAIDVREGLNKAYYGKEISPEGIIVKRSVSNKGSAALLSTLKDLVK
ncbi:MAG TPA: lipid-binding SYLF domain-containing protein [Nitrospiria bacterium]|nr:lipid-binding SYLF domain-containing protein [Nitrospiria bacterium]